MQIKEIRLLEADIFQNDIKIFSGKIEDAYSQYGDYETKEIHFEDGKINILI